MNTRNIRALMRKDIALFINNRFYMLLTVIGLVCYIGLYFVLPSNVDENLSLAMYAPEMPPVFNQLTSQPGTAVQIFSSETGLKQSILDGNYQAGVVLPSDIMEIWNHGGIPVITVYYNSGAPPEVTTAIVALVKELSYAQTGQVLQFDTTGEVLGNDLLGAQIPLRDRMRPLLVVFILLMETLSVASLIAVEIEQGTARAILTTPLKVSDLFLAKGILGVGLAFGQGILFMALVGGFNHLPLLMLTTLLIGSFMVVGIGFFLASVTRDVMSVTGWGTLVLVLLAIPGIGMIIPGLISGWAKLIPSYYLTDAVSRIANYGAGWRDAITNLGILTGFSIIMFWAGMVILRRRYL